MGESSFLRAIGDVHGESRLLERAVADAGRIVLLGDLVDRGPDSPGVLRLTLKLIAEGRARLVRSNHDDKLYRALTGRPVKMGTQLTRTMEGLRRVEDAARLIDGFIAAFEAAPFVIAEGGYVFAHGAVDPRRFKAAAPDEPRERDAMALYGEVRGELKPDGKPLRHYDWVDAIPAPWTAVVGHDCRGGSTPFVQYGALGGRAIFMDTGAGKGGPLSFIDLPSETVGRVLPGRIAASA